MNKLTLSNGDLPEVYKKLEELFEMNQWQETLNGCHQVLSKFPDEWPYWLLASRCQTYLESYDRALSDIMKAIELAPKDELLCIYQLHTVYILKNRPDWIAQSINQIFPTLPRAKQDELTHHAFKFLSLGAILKYEFSNEVLSHIIRLGLNE